MFGRIVEITEDCRHLFVLRGFMVIRATDDKKQELGKIPLDGIASVIANAYGMSYTNNLLIALGERNIPLVICSNNHNVSSMLLPVDGNGYQAKRFDAQIATKLSLKKRLWAQIIKSKLMQQAAVLEAIGQNNIPITALIPKVKSGDSGNVEAQAARRYWRLLFGEHFRRNSDNDKQNTLLNYGYTVMRAATARAVVSAGLHPTIGLHHSNETNAMRLVDDLMEPFRPLIDFKVWQLAKNNKLPINPELKRALVSVLYQDIPMSDGVTQVAVAIQKLATSLTKIFLMEEKTLELPLSSLPILLNKEVC